MCGIVGGITSGPAIKDLLIDGLHRLEYRGYDSAGIALIEKGSTFHQLRAKGKVSALEEKSKSINSTATSGIAHTRWATHGAATQKNAHPHLIDNRLLIVHNGIIENYVQLKKELGNITLHSQTDTEIAGWVILNELRKMKSPNLRKAVLAATKKCKGSYAISIMDISSPEHLVAIRKGSPLVLGIGEAGTFIASDPLALIQHTDSFIFINENECVEILGNSWSLFNTAGKKLQRQPQTILAKDDANDKKGFDHYMLKEIHEQPSVLDATLNSYLDKGKIVLGEDRLVEKLAEAQAVQMVACGTSAHAAQVAQYWIEELVGIPCWTEVASEFRYRTHPEPNNVLYITLSQSGETADTLECLRMAKDMPYSAQIAITNSPYSSIVRECDYTLLTRCGVEVSVASTKAFTTQLLVLLLCTLKMAHQRKKIPLSRLTSILNTLKQLPSFIEKFLLKQSREIELLARELFKANNVMFLGRHTMHPVALEGALKLKEIAYIHAEAYPAGELKHGPIALIDAYTPIVAVSPPSELLHKLHINLEEVQARGGKMLLFLDNKQKFTARSFDKVVKIPHIDTLLAPILYTIPLQLLAYYSAVQRGTDVDKPRNLAKSVTVE